MTLCIENSFNIIQRLNMSYVPLPLLMPAYVESPRLCPWPSTLHMYTSPLSTLISSLSLNHHLYADDTQLFLSFRPPDNSSVTHLQNALQHISSWMTANLLTLNSSKTEFLLIGLNNNSLKFTTAHSIPLIQLEPWFHLR